MIRFNNKDLGRGAAPAGEPRPFRGGGTPAQEGGAMSDETTATWRYVIGQQVRWAGDPAQTYTITARRWVERQTMAPYAEYQVHWPGGELLWVVEADVDELAQAAGEDAV